MRQKEESPEPLATLLENILPELRQCVKDALSQYGVPDKRIGYKTINAYIDRAVRATRSQWTNGVVDGSALRDLLSREIRSLVDLDEIKIAEIVAQTDWSMTTKLVLAVAVKRHQKGVNRYGACAEDYVTDAILLLLQRRRHFPYYKGVTLVKFLVRTVDNLYNHAHEALKSEGAHLALTNKRSRGAATDEFHEDDLVAPAVNNDELAAAETLEAFLESLDDPDVKLYSELRMTPPRRSAKELAQVMGRSVSQIRNVHRRFMRRVMQRGGCMPPVQTHPRPVLPR